MLVVVGRRLVYIWLTMCLRSPQTARISLSVRRQAVAVRFSYGFTRIAASTILYKKKVIQIFKNRKPVGRRHIGGGGFAPSMSPYLRTASARKPHGLRAISVQSLRRLRGDRTEIARFPYNLRAASVRICPDQSPERPYTNSHDTRI